MKRLERAKSKAEAVSKRHLDELALIRRLQRQKLGVGRKQKLTAQERETKRLLDAKVCVLLCRAHRSVATLVVAQGMRHHCCSFSRVDIWKTTGRRPIYPNPVLGRASGQGPDEPTAVVYFLFFGCWNSYMSHRGYM